MADTAEKIAARRAEGQRLVAERKANADRLAAARLATAEANAESARIRADKAAAGDSVPWTARSAGALNPATPGGAGSAAGLVVLAGAVAFFGNMKIDKAFPKAGLRIITATIALAIILSLLDNGRLSPVARGLAGLMLLAAVIKYVPILSNSKGKKNG